MVGARCWGTPVEIGCLLTYRQLISGCRAVRNLSPTGALLLFHESMGPAANSFQGTLEGTLVSYTLVSWGYIYEFFSKNALESAVFGG